MRYLVIVIILTLLLIPIVRGEGVESEEDFIAKIEMMKAHLHASIVNKENGYDYLAIAHAGHPIGELYQLIKNDLTNLDPFLASKVENKLNQVFKMASNTTLEAYRIEVNDTITLLNEVEVRYAKDKLEDPSFLTKVIIELLDEASDEYGEGLDENCKLVNIVEYQDSQEFFLRAREIFNGIRSFFNEPKIEESFNKLDNSIKEVKCTESVKAEISSLIYDLKLTLDKRFMYINNMNRILVQIIENYKEGNNKGLDILINELRSNYSQIQNYVSSYDKDLDRDINKLIEDLMHKINTNDKLDSVKDTIERIRASLNIVERYVIPEFPFISILVLAIVTLLSIIIIVRCSKDSLTM